PQQRAHGEVPQNNVPECRRDPVTERRLRGRTRQRATMMFVRGRMVDVDLGDLDRWCRAHLSAGVDEVLFRDGYLSTVLGVRLSSGQRVVGKVRHKAERLEACWMAHCSLFERGFPCPIPLAAS